MSFVRFFKVSDEQFGSIWRLVGHKRMARVAVDASLLVARKSRKISTRKLDFVHFMHI